MRNKRLNILITLMAGAAMPVAVAITPDALVAEALERNPELKFYTAEINAAKGTVRTARTIRNPELNAQAGYKNVQDNSDGGNGDGAAWSISLTQTFEYPGRIALRKAIASRDVDLAQLHLQQFRRTLAARTRALAYSIGITSARSATAREIASRFQSLSEVLQERPAAGITPQLEARIIHANGLSFRRQEREAALAETTIRAELNQLRGRAANSSLAVTAGSVSFGATTLPNLIKAGHSNAFEIRIRQAELVQQGLKVALSKNERYPAVAVGPYYTQENAADKEQQVGLGLSLPLPFWDRNTGSIETSSAREQQAKAGLLTAEAEVERRVTQNFATLQAKRTEIDTLQANELATARETAELADRNYRLGAVPLTIYVETQKQYLDLVTTICDLQKEALQAAQELEILTGAKLYRAQPLP